MDEIDTEIHNHPFCGAFRLLRGKSVHFSYSFTPNLEKEKNIFEGELKLLRSSIQSIGTCTEITAESIHSIARIEKSNITLIITDKSKSQNGFFIYPELYIENIKIRGEINRKIQAISLMKGNRESSIITLLKDLDLYELLTIAFRLNIYSFSITYESNLKIELNNLIQSELDSRGESNYLLSHSTHLDKLQQKVVILKK
jgi:hypothetical protein